VGPGFIGSLGRSLLRTMITFIIPAHNEELLIGRTISVLHAAGAALNEPYEVIVVDDASTDATTKVAARCGARVVSVNYRQIAAARNAGAAQAQGDLLVFVDADTDVPGRVVGAAVHAMRSGAVGGGARARFEGSVPIYGRILEWLGGALFESGGNDGVAFVLDLTEQRRAQKDLQQAQQSLYTTQVELARVSRLTTMGELAASIG
jgi:glycosyltransferase involved in cell wall biosynthesis